MLVGTALVRIWHFFLSSVLCFQMTAGAVALFVCTHADGSQRIETFSQQAACHSASSDAAETQARSFTAADCTDQAISTTLLSARPSHDQHRIDPPLPLPFPIWPQSILPAAAPAKRHLPGPNADHLPAAEQHALLLSAVVLLI